MEREAITTRTAKTCQDYSESIKCLLTTSSSRAFILLEVEQRLKTGQVPRGREKSNPAGGVLAAAAGHKKTVLGLLTPFKHWTSRGVKGLGTGTPGGSWPCDGKGEAHFLKEPQRDSSHLQSPAKPNFLVGKQRTPHAPSQG